MQVGLMVPQGWKGEYDGWEAAKPGPERWSWPTGEERGLKSLWVIDHFHRPRATEEITFESFSTLAALRAVDLACPPRAHGGLHRVPQSGPHREAELDHRCHQRRPFRAGYRRRLEGG